jgi:hypothetical protein
MKAIAVLPRQPNSIHLAELTDNKNAIKVYVQAKAEV